MKPGQLISPEVIALVARARELEAGRISYRHPRHGIVVIAIVNNEWRIESMERP